MPPPEAPEEFLRTRIQQESSRHISVSSFDGIVTEVGTLVGQIGMGETYVVRCHRASEAANGRLDFGAIHDPMLLSGFHYHDGQWSFVMRKCSQIQGQV